MESSLGIVIDLGDESEAVKTPLSAHRRKHVDRSVSSIDFVDSLQDPPLSLRSALILMAKDKASRPALVLVGTQKLFVCLFVCLFFFFPQRSLFGFCDSGTGRQLLGQQPLFGGFCVL